jgi:catechol 2,3-dioxygenase-like lactoylglutathione lyase family enzyme
MSRLFGKAVHAAYVVPDIQAAMQDWLERGFGPFYLMDHITPDARCRGERNNPCISAAFFNSGDMQIELLQPHDETPTAYREYLARHPEGGLHHIAYWADTLEGALDHAAKKGFEFTVVQEFIYPDGTPYEIYVEPKGKPDGTLVQLMIDSPVRGFFDHVTAEAAKWDGSEPIRDALPILGDMDLNPA